MLLLIALLTALVSVGLGLLLPLFTWVRTSRLEQHVRDVNERLRLLEAGLRFAHPGATAAEAAPTSPAHSAASSPETPAAAERVEQVPASQPPPVPQHTPVAARPTHVPPLSPGTTAHADTTRERETAAERSVHATAAIDEPAAASPLSIEDAIGGRLTLWIGAIVLLLGVAFFLKYAFEHSWITPTMRVVLGIAAGGAFVVAGIGFVRRGYAVYGQIVAGVGLAMLFLDVYAAYSFYALIGRTAAFVLLVAVTAGAAALADRQRSLGLALMAVGGGFATPFLVGGTTDAQLTLFTYDAVLVVGTLYLANRQDWPALNVLSFALTWLTIAAWGASYYEPAKWLRTELFLTLFTVLFLALLRAQVARHGWYSSVSLVLAAGPAIYHLASLAVLDSQSGVHLHVYLIAVTMVVLGISARAGWTGLRLISWAAVVVPLAAWMDVHSSRVWLVPNAVSACAIFALHAWAQVDVVHRQQRTLGGLDALLQHVNGYALMMLLYDSLSGVALARAPYAMLAVGVVHAGLARQYARADWRAALNALAVAFGALTVALAIELDGPWLTAALAAEAVVLTGIGLRLAQQAYRFAGGALLAVAIARYVTLSLPATPAVFTMSDEALIMGLALAGACYTVALLYRRWGAGLPLWTVSPRTLAAVTGSVLIVLAVSAENNTYWSLRGDVSSDARFAESLALSAIWLACASAFLAVGWVRQFPPMRYLAMSLFGLSVLKVFLVDLSSLGGIYRILGFIGLGLTLLAVSFVYQRGRKKPDDVAA